MMSEIQFAYYAASIIVISLGLSKSAYNGSLRRVYDNLNRIQEIEKSVDTLSDRSETIQQNLEDSAEKQERLIAAVVALSNYPDRVSPQRVEQLLTEDKEQPSPTDFFGPKQPQDNSDSRHGSRHGRGYWQSYNPTGTVEKRTETDTETDTETETDEKNI